MKYFVLPDENLKLNTSSRSTLRGSFISLSDGITHYELAGPEDGEVVVLVGGLTVPLLYWDRIAEQLREAGFRTLVYSSYGRGYSDRVRERYDSALFVRQLSELILALNLGRKYHVVGASMGALIAMGHSILNTSAVATLTVAGPAGLSEKPAALRWLQSSERLFSLFAKYLGKKWLKKHEANDLEDRTHAPELSAMLSDAFRYEGSTHAVFDTLLNFGLFMQQPLYKSIGDSPIPTMLIWGSKDRVTPITHINDAKTLLQPQQCHVLDCGHMVPFERTHFVAQKIVSFLAVGK
ncbi:alpha/beta fold hydrolase [Ectopseudomonas guguanensis]|jgi:pimeloyl-ACP methyl ester carboxylesterase|uniref:alpha/beta fold hydrolase n=1 Tax=Ectopseudomonas guguanensis TaxID=1198456 RepID=UPI0012D66573|nr:MULTISPECIES: alpha/beta hydrolase [Pseudomonas]MPT18137.1 alpha/beta hydrolase [Pseudomonas sp.]WJH56169.1 alpha/beta hydrolase [Pseudomonas guguanensis]